MPNFTSEKRAHHNQLERTRRNGIKSEFEKLHSSLPQQPGEKSSRANTLKRAISYIQEKKLKIAKEKEAIDQINRQNKCLEYQIRLLTEKCHDMNVPVPSDEEQEEKNVTIDEQEGGSSSQASVNLMQFSYGDNGASTSNQIDDVLQGDVDVSGCTSDDSSSSSHSSSSSDSSSSSEEQL